MVNLRLTFIKYTYIYKSLYFAITYIRRKDLFELLSKASVQMKILKHFRNSELYTYKKCIRNLHTFLENFTTRFIFPFKF